MLVLVSRMFSEYRLPGTYLGFLGSSHNWYLCSYLWVMCTGVVCGQVHITGGYFLVKIWSQKKLGSELRVGNLYCLSKAPRSGPYGAWVCTN